VSVARKWVFPIIRIVVFAAIAAALVKIAFFADPAPQQAGEFPSGAIVEPQIPVMLGTVRNDILLDGTVGADVPVEIKAPLDGEIRQLSVKAGQRVKKGAELMQIRGFYDDGTHRWSIVKAPASGVLTSFDLLVGQHVGVGETIGQVAPPSFSVTATLAPEQLYRLTTKPTEAEVTIVGGPAPFTCARLKIITPVPGAVPGEGEEGGSTGTSVRCKVPGDVRVFAGLTAQLTIAGGIAENVLTVPTTAVEGGSGTGVVYLVGADGATEPREVTLGLSDGISVEVTGGLAEGDMILQFVPGAPADPGMIDPGMGEGGFVEIEG
jgi:macrolide-specific efflux system membrane fusion protein